MENIFIDISVIVVCAAVMAWLATLGRQPIIIAYLIMGILIGPWGFGLIQHVTLIDSIGQIGVTLLLFLAGMVLHPNRLFKLFRTSTLVTLAHSTIAWVLLFILMRLCGFSLQESMYASLAFIFSSTILVVKLLPTTTLHQRYMGSVCIAILIIQDLLAVGFLVFIRSSHEHSLLEFGMALPLKALLLIIFSMGLEQFCLRKMMRQCDRFHEELYMLCLGWCLGISALAKEIGLSYEVGAFIAGLALARSPLSRFLTEGLKPLRDFFLMFFFFALGAKLDLKLVKELWVPTLTLGTVILVTRPFIFQILFKKNGEQGSFSKEIGLRLGQASEFGLIIAVTLESAQQIRSEVAQLIQITIIFTMLVSSYIVISKCPTPLGTHVRLKQD